jgi:hypothetical protein
VSGLERRWRSTRKSWSGKFKENWRRRGSMDFFDKEKGNWSMVLD